jgi:transcriptional regulator with XRE-family HTH domain
MLTFDHLVYPSVGQRIADLRKLKGWTQKQLEEALDSRGFTLKRSSIAQIEKGAQRVMLHALFHIAEVMEVEVTQLIPSINELAGEKKTKNVSPEIAWAKSAAEKALTKERSNAT